MNVYTYILIYIVPLLKPFEPEDEIEKLPFTVKVVLSRCSLNCSIFAIYIIHSYKRLLFLFIYICTSRTEEIILKCSSSYYYYDCAPSSIIFFYIQLVRAIYVCDFSYFVDTLHFRCTHYHRRQLLCDTLISSVS